MSQKSNIEGLANDLIEKMNDLNDLGGVKMIDNIMKIEGVMEHKTEIKDMLAKLESECSHLPIFQQLKNKFS